MSSMRFGAGVAVLALIASSVSAKEHKVDSGESAGESKARTSRAIQPMMLVTLPLPTPVPRSLGGYTRIVADFQVHSTDHVRNYNEERRSSLARFLAGKTIARLLTVKATLARPRVSTITTFASFDYTSNRKSGESWASEVDPQRVLTPYFRIDADSAISLEATASATSTYQMNVAAGLLDVIKRAAKLVAPTTTLITSLNKERFEDASSFVDQSLSSVLQESLVERSTNDFPMKDWVGRELLTIEVWMPIANEITPARLKAKPREEPKLLGKWTIRSVPAVLSVFSDTPLLLTSSDDRVQVNKPSTNRRNKGRAAVAAEDKAKTTSQCGDSNPDIIAACAAFKTLDPQTVLNFQVDSGVSLAQALAGESGIAAAREHLLQNATANTDTARENANALCTLVADKAHVLGFNRFDVAAILWAYSSQSFVTKVAGVALRDEANCSPLKIAYSVGLPKGGFAAAEADASVTPVPAAVVTPAAVVPGGAAPLPPG